MSMNIDCIIIDYRWFKGIISCGNCRFSKSSLFKVNVIGIWGENYNFVNKFWSKCETLRGCKYSKSAWPMVKHWIIMIYPTMSVKRRPVPPCLRADLSWHVLCSLGRGQVVSGKTPTRIYIWLKLNLTPGLTVISSAAPCLNVDSSSCVSFSAYSTPGPVRTWCPRARFPET